MTCLTAKIVNLGVEASSCGAEGMAYGISYSQCAVVHIPKDRKLACVNAVERAVKFASWRVCAASTGTGKTVSMTWPTLGNARHQHAVYTRNMHGLTSSDKSHLPQWEYCVRR